MATASAIILTKNDILHSMSFLNKKDMAARILAETSPTMENGSATMLTAGTKHDITAQVSAAIHSSIVSAEKPSVIIGTILFMR